MQIALLKPALVIAGPACNPRAMNNALVPLLIASVLATLPATATANGAATTARPANYPGNWVTEDDYPAAARRDQREGKTSFQLSIDELGAMTGCAIVKSSGSPDLDAETCALMIKRARFHPAIDANGKPAPATFRSTVIWVRPH